jgi:hypothetical protein
MSNPIVKAGDPVEPDTVLARVAQPPHPVLLQVAEAFNVQGSITPYVLRSIGDSLEPGDTIARMPGMFGRSKRVRAPIAGKLKAIYPTLGVALLEVSVPPLQIRSLVYGNIMQVTYDQSILMEVEGDFLWGALGWGAERRGTLARYTNLGKQADAGALYFSPGVITRSMLKEARSRGVTALIGSGIGRDDWQTFTDDPSEDLPTLMLLHGFSNAPLDETLQSHVQSYEGRTGTLLIHQGADGLGPRPQLIFQPEDASTVGSTQGPEALEVRRGQTMIVRRAPLLGSTVLVDDILELPQKLPTGARVFAAQVSVAGKSGAVIPIINLEHVSD